MSHMMGLDVLAQYLSDKTCPYCGVAGCLALSAATEVNLTYIRALHCGNCGSDMKEIYGINSIETMEPWPIFNLTPAAGTRPGLYLGLSHGRVHPDAAPMLNCGPLIGPLEYCHTTYAATVNIAFLDKKAEKAYCPALLSDDEMANGLRIDNNGFLVVGGKYWGDWTVFYRKEE